MNSLKNLILLAIIFGAIGATYLYSDLILLPFFILLLLLMATFNKDEFNFTYLIKVIIAFTIVESLLGLTIFKLITHKPGFIQNSIIFTSHLIIDILIAYFISNRKSICLKYIKNISIETKKEIFEKSLLDAPLLGVYLLFCIVDTLALLENLLRHLDKIGFPAEAASKFSDFQFLYNNYEYIKYALLSLVLLLFISLFIRKATSGSQLLHRR
ncbi:hypothetical protein NI389_05105 [Pseudoalteromonas xiamenensis]|uniref:hypothetical protein n=1 Tax=Pseudoalteromonas xiamenensis TaxID=882626 RepID=UPI0027E43A49|nr:hypothetical protein [Pseudoalteromonas xiamenensis]WMN60691.1 hypothetical protein NI389_04595 [Pseudoalteromonas xiamenensis]WMN60788.1 hypothetical protein NI389_05105 [Pseudoalteromonas xiamenensis]